MFNVSLCFLLGCVRVFACLLLEKQIIKYRQICHEAIELVYVAFVAFWIDTLKSIPIIIICLKLHLSFVHTIDNCLHRLETSRTHKQSTNNLMIWFLLFFKYFGLKKKNRKNKKKKKKNWNRDRTYNVFEFMCVTYETFIQLKTNAQFG